VSTHADVAAWFREVAGLTDAERAHLGVRLTGFNCLEVARILDAGITLFKCNPEPEGLPWPPTCPACKRGKLLEWRAGYWCDRRYMPGELCDFEGGLGESIDVAMERFQKEQKRQS
jgi:hypothetical protein